MKTGKYFQGVLQDRNYNKAEILFYIAKFELCKLFKLRKKRATYNEIPILSYGGGYGWEGDYNWTEEAIGEGIFKNWYYVIYPNGI